MFITILAVCAGRKFFLCSFLSSDLAGRCSSPRSVMALNMSLLGCLILACALNFVNAQTLSESVFKQLSAAELRDISLMQNPMLLDLAARTGESVTVIISAAEQGAIVQESVNTILDCTEWASNFPGGTIMWYKYTYNDLDHTDLGARTPQIPDLINNAQIPRATIRGDFYQIYEIIRAIISMDAEDSSRGIYECEVCIARGIPAFEVCHSANTTVATAGRPPIIDEGTGRGELCQTQHSPLLLKNVKQCMHTYAYLTRCWCTVTHKLVSPTNSLWGPVTQ